MDIAKKKRSVDEVLQCFICLSRIQNAQMLPCCSKLACAHCIEPWLVAHARCPHCRASVRIAHLVPCRFLADVVELLDDVMQSGDKAERDARVREDAPEVYHDTCPLHEAPYFYFCRTCSEAICSDCAMFGDKHKDHSFEHLRDAYSRCADDLRTHRTALLQRQESLLLATQATEHRMEAVTSAKETCAVGMRAAIDETLERLEAQTRSRLQPLLAHETYIQEQRRLFLNMTDELDKELQTASPAMLVARFKNWSASLEELQSSYTDSLDPPDVSTEFLNEMVPPFAEGALIIENFTEVPDSADPIYSEAVSTTPGVNWRLKVYPHGNGSARGTFLSVFVELQRNKDEVVVLPAQRYLYRIELVNHSQPDASLVREYTSSFVPGESWGYNRLFLIDALYDEGFLASASRGDQPNATTSASDGDTQEDRPNRARGQNDRSPSASGEEGETERGPGMADCLELRFGVRAPSYYDQSQVLWQHIHTLTAQVNAAKALAQAQTTESAPPTVSSTQQERGAGSSDGASRKHPVSPPSRASPDTSPVAAIHISTTTAADDGGDDDDDTTSVEESGDEGHVDGSRHAATLFRRRHRVRSSVGSGKSRYRAPYARGRAVLLRAARVRTHRKRSESGSRPGSVQSGGPNMPVMPADGGTVQPASVSQDPPLPPALPPPWSTDSGQVAESVSAPKTFEPSACVQDGNTERSTPSSSTSERARPDGDDEAGAENGGPMRVGHEASSSLKDYMRSLRDGSGVGGSALNPAHGGERLDAIELECLSLTDSDADAGEPPLHATLPSVDGRHSAPVSGRPDSLHLSLGRPRRVSRVDATTTSQKPVSAAPGLSAGRSSSALDTLQANDDRSDGQSVLDASLRARRTHGTYAPDLPLSEAEWDWLTMLGAGDGDGRVGGYEQHYQLFEQGAGSRWDREMTKRMGVEQSHSETVVGHDRTPSAGSISPQAVVEAVADAVRATTTTTTATAPVDSTEASTPQTAHPPPDESMSLSVDPPTHVAQSQSPRTVQPIAPPQPAPRSPSPRASQSARSSSSNHSPRPTVTTPPPRVSGAVTTTTPTRTSPAPPASESRTPPPME